MTTAARSRRTARGFPQRRFRVSSAAMLPRLLVALALGLSTAAGPVADAAAPPLPFPAAPPTACEALSGQLVTGLFGSQERVGDFAVTVTFDAGDRALDSMALTTHFQNAIEAALRARVVAAGARLPASGEGVAERVDLALLLDAGQLSATAVRTRLPTNVWERLATPGGQVVKTAFSSWAIDLEIRTLLGLDRTAARLDALRVVSVTDKTVALAPAPILDVVIGDLDGDWLPEVALLQPDRVRVLAWQKGGFTVDRASFDLGVLPPNDARLRAPIGRLVVVTRGDGSALLVVASSDRASSAILELDPGAGLVAVDASGTPDGWPLYATGIDAWVVTDWPRGVDVLAGQAREVGLGGSGVTRLASLSGAYDVRAFPLRGNTSPTWQPALARTAVGGELELWTAAAAASPINLRNQGTAHVVVDLDGDGVIELLTTSDAIDGRDRLTLSQLRTGQRGPRRVWSGEVKSPVTAAAAGDVDRDGYREFVVATWDGRAADLLIVVPRT